MKPYIDTSVVVRRLLKQPGAFERWRGPETPVTSELVEVEALRTLDRLHVQGRLDDGDFAERISALHAMIGSFECVPLTRAVLQGAGRPFPTAVGTLDAIHLATALLWIEERDEPLTFLTHDAQQALAARACGLEVQTAP
jgi:predicted nucleic acid-binding protein